jgi:hypothetical protein
MRARDARNTVTTHNETKFTMFKTELRRPSAAFVLAVSPSSWRWVGSSYATIALSANSVKSKAHRQRTVLDKAYNVPFSIVVFC